MGNILVLGRLFTTTRTDTQRIDLITVVTPRLVLSPNKRLPALAPVVPVAVPGETGTTGIKDLQLAPVAPLLGLVPPILPPPSLP